MAKPETTPGRSVDAWMKVVSANFRFDHRTPTNCYALVHACQKRPKLAAEAQRYDHEPRNNRRNGHGGGTDLFRHGNRLAMCRARFAPIRAYIEV
jgi:hypothetical protein